MLMYGIALTEVHLALLNSMKFSWAHFLILSAVLNDIPFFFCVSLVSFAILLIQHSISAYAIDEDIKGCWFRNSLRDTTCHQPPPGHRGRPQPCGCIQPSNSLLTKISTLQIHISPIWRRWWHVGPCWRPYRTLGRWHWSVFPCWLLSSLHYRKPLDWSGTICL